MRLPIDFKSRLEDLNRRRLLSVSGSQRVARLWAFILVFGLLLTLAAIGAAGYRFLYWGDVDNYSPKETSDAPLYDEASLEEVLRTYGEKEARVADILTKDWESEAPPAASTTTAFEDQNAID